ncbi:hypothetical protein ElyMa_002394200 [Elysia marginata]|uniref:Uncharacterized protein n=1 Tax=Elysia marginata TaxID=1093978 RepID=A0AAV4GEH2_9GAST|nr:hypothetical protein ElyMa_002394200 [Elysia marginata]
MTTESTSWSLGWEFSVSRLPPVGSSVERNLTPRTFHSSGSPTQPAIHPAPTTPREQPSPALPSPLTHASTQWEVPLTGFQAYSPHGTPTREDRGPYCARRPVVLNTRMAAKFFARVERLPDNEAKLTFDTSSVGDSGRNFDFQARNHHNIVAEIANCLEDDGEDLFSKKLEKAQNTKCIE